MTHFSHRLGASLAIALVAVGALGTLGALAAPAPVAHAQTPAASAVIPPAAGAAAAAPAAGAPKGGEGTTPPKAEDKDSVAGWLMSKVASLFAWFLGVAAVILDYVVFYTVIKMGDFVNGVSNIGVAWRIMRDLGNIFLIFGFLASGIMVIINASYFGFGSKMLPMLLVAAVFLNFSLFISEAIIDVGNLFATEVYTQINHGTAPTPDTMRNSFLTSVSNEGISNSIMRTLGLEKIYDVGAGGGTIQVTVSSGAWYVGFMAIFLFIIAAFVFFSLAFILVARFVALIFLIVVAPIGFAGLAIPKLSGLANQWWGWLVEQTITAPALLLLLYVAVAVITDEKFLLEAGNRAGAASVWTGFLDGKVGGLADFGSVLLSFLIAMGLLLAVAVAAKRLSAMGASGATKLAGKLSFGAVAYGARGTLGWAAQSGSRRFNQSKLARVPVLGRAIGGTLNRGAKASFDVRGTSLLKNIGGIDAGKAREGGYRKEEEDAIKAREEHAKNLQLTPAEREQRSRVEEARVLAENRASRTERQHRDEANSLRDTHQADLDRPGGPTETVNNARAALRVAERSGVAADIASAQTDLNNALRDYEFVRDTQRAELDTQKRRQEPILAAQRRGAAIAQERVAEISRRPQEAYARGISRSPGNLRYRNTKAAENIILNARKSKEQKDVDAMMDALRRNSTPPPAPPPAGGGTP